VPSSVGSTTRGVRRSKDTPSAASSLAIRRLTVALLSPMSFAVAVNDRRSTASAKARRSWTSPMSVS
jgi:hypothetical protein